MNADPNSTQYDVWSDPPTYVTAVLVVGIVTGTVAMSLLLSAVLQGRDVVSHRGPIGVLLLVVGGVVIVWSATRPTNPEPESSLADLWPDAPAYVLVVLLVGLAIAAVGLLLVGIGIVQMRSQQRISHDAR